MTTKYTLKKTSVIKTFLPHFVIAILFSFFFGNLMILSKDSYDFYIIAIVTFIFVFLLLWFYPFFILINYYQNDRKISIIIDNEKCILKILSKDKEKAIHFDDILFIEEIFSGGYLIHLFKIYYYRVITKDKKVYFFSRLLITRLDKKIDFIISPHRVFFPIMRKGF